MTGKTGVLTGCEGNKHGKIHPNIAATCYNLKYQQNETKGII